jgi:energy-coupling factor transport system substrate-specific component
VLGIDARARAMLLLVSVAGLAMFLWPLLVTPSVAILPCLLAVVLSEMTAGRMDTKVVAMLGVLAAMGAALRPMGAGVAGIETVLFLLVLAGRVYGAGFGFVLGALTLFASALITGGVGPWLPFQMLAAAWVGLGAGLLPRARGRAEIAVLAVYGVVAAYAYGFLLNLWFWPFALGSDTQLSFHPGASVLHNLHRFGLYTLASSTLGWDTGRAVTNLVAILVIGPTALVTLRRAARRAAFGAAVDFGDVRLESRSDPAASVPTTGVSEAG